MTREDLMSRTGVAAILADDADLNEWIMGTPGDDLLDGGAGDDGLAGFAGADTLIGGAGADALWGDSENGSKLWDGTNAIKKPDTARYDFGPPVDLIAVLDGEVTFAGLPGETDRIYDVENLWSGGGDDRVIGNAAANELRGGRGRDTLLGGRGDDTLVGQGEQDRLDGEEGRDTAVYAENTTPVQIDLKAGTAAFLRKPWAAETLISIENVVSGGGADLVRGSAGANTLDGGEGADTIDGRGGSDTVSYASHGSRVEVDLTHQRGVVTDTGVTDVLISIEGATGGGGDDRLIGNFLANRLNGGDGDDFISAEGGNDTFLLAAGNDTLEGGVGADTLVWTPTYDDFYELHYTFDLIGHYGDPSITYSGDVTPDCLIDLRSGLALGYTAEGTSQINGIENVVTGVGNDVVIGDDRANVISVGHGCNHVDGGGGADLITGSNARWEYRLLGGFFADTRDLQERLWGGSGNDTLIGGNRMNGGAGDDRLVAGWAQNIMSGGAGADTFEFSADHETYGFYTTVLAQSGRLLDFDAAGGDRVAIDWTGTDLPEFAGYGVTRLDLEVGQYSIVGGTLYVGLDRATDGEIDYVDGLRIVAPGITAEDVFFI
jgi:Ca2+-binding RTX toxin-like protein